MLGVVLCLADALQRKRAWWVAPSYPMSMVGWREIKRLATQIPGTVLREADRIVTLPGGGWVQVRSADNPDSLRGEGLDFCVLDECAFIAEAAFTEALRPALSDRQGRALFISTPKGRNWFWRIWQRGQDGGEWRSWQLPTAANPYIVPAEIETAKASLPERIFAQEYLADFIEDGGGVFRRVLESATSTPHEQAVDGHQYAIGVDWGKHNDWTVLAVLDLTDRALVHLDRFNQIDYSLQTARLRALQDRFKARPIIVERNSMGEPLIEQLERERLPVQSFQTTNQSKAAAIDALALAFERGDVRIVADPVLLGELQAYEMERLPSGMLRYSAPEGMHDDTVMALALAWQAAAHPLAKVAIQASPFY